MQIIPVESSIKRRFYLKRGEKSGRLMHRIGKRAGYIYKTLSRYTYRTGIATGHAKMLITLAVISKYRRFHHIDILKSANILRVSK